MRNGPLGPANNTWGNDESTIGKPISKNKNKRRGLLIYRISISILLFLSVILVSAIAFFLGVLWVMFFRATVHVATFVSLFILAMIGVAVGKTLKEKEEGEENIIDNLKNLWEAIWDGE